ncbi:ferritin-like domain-containing protein [Actinoplanes sp. LDG1-06]|uniref:Ferritin-like domain-containing protein n=1 Tax=Paractinoplanes ovalisporus TaxID=2810368 RepID=A0ABS2ACW0_9ACTN|nr:ferritin-like domain-containing protein [Actinoplanes ovalisporus]MBM2617662.1 ferritin-like domain-containing protein [Actinoplanes ovalisporus]
MNPQLGAALAAEEAAIYAYGIIGVNLSTTGDVTEARTAEQAHRGRRDYLVGRLAQLQASSAPSPAGYQLPFEVTDRAGALKLAIHVEDGVAQAWRPVLPVTTGNDRATALAAMTEAAVRATRWRRLAAVSPVTLPFPGRP